MSDERSIDIIYKHNVKGLLGTAYTEEAAFFWLKGFSEETIAEQPERFKKTIEKILADMKKSYTFTTMLDIKDIHGNLAYRINPHTENTEKGWNVYFEILSFRPGMYTFSDLHRAEKKEIMSTLNAFFTEQFVTAYAA